MANHFISNCLELQDMQNDLAGYHKLAGDIDCFETRTWNGGEGFAPVGIFTGEFDGNHYKIFDLYISRPAEDVGLFMKTSSSTKIVNIGLERVDVVGGVTTAGNVGGLVGYNRFGSISNSYSTGSVSGIGTVGGLVGCSAGPVSNSYSTASVTGTYTIGGLIGFNDGGGLVSNSYFTGSVAGGTYVGGLVGVSYGSISNSYSTGSVIGSNKGGLIGILSGGSILFSYYDKDTSGQSDTGKGAPKTTIEMMQQATFVGWDFIDIWYINEGVDYPKLLAPTPVYPTPIIETPTAPFVTPTAPFVTPTVPILTPTAPFVTPTVPAITPTPPIVTPTVPRNTPTPGITREYLTPTAPFPTPIYPTPLAYPPTPEPAPIIATPEGESLIISINSLGKVEVSSPGIILIVTMTINPAAGKFVPYKEVPGMEISSGRVDAFGPVDDINEMFSELRFALASASYSSTSVSITVEDGKNAPAHKTVSLSSFRFNRSPVIDRGIQGSMKVKAIRSFIYEVPSNAFNDPDGDSLTYTVTEDVSWLTYNADENCLSGMPPKNSVGQTHSLQLTASDDYGGASSVNFSIEVINKNPKEGEGIPDQIIPLESRYEYTIPHDVFTDDDDAQLSYEVRLMQDGVEALLPVWLSFDGSRLYGTPSINELDKTYEIQVIGSDGVNDVSVSFSLTVSNKGPVLHGSIPDQEAAVDYLFDCQFVEDLFVDENAITYSAHWIDGEIERLLVPPFWLSFDSENRRFSGVPQVSDLGKFYSIQLTASDGYSGTSLQFQIRVRNNRPPELIEGLETQKAYVGEPFTLMIPNGTFIDPDNDTLTYDATEKDQKLLMMWLQLSSDIFSGQPDKNDVGTRTVVLTASDHFGANVTHEFDIKVSFTAWGFIEEYWDYLAEAISGVFLMFAGIKWLLPYAWNNWIKPFPKATLSVRRGEETSFIPKDNKGNPIKFKDIRAELVKGKGIVKEGFGKRLKRWIFGGNPPTPPWISWNMGCNVIGITPPLPFPQEEFELSATTWLGLIKHQTNVTVEGDVEMHPVQPLQASGLSQSVPGLLQTQASRPLQSQASGPSQSVPGPSQSQVSGLSQSVPGPLQSQASGPLQPLQASGPSQSAPPSSFLLCGGVLEEDAPHCSQEVSLGTPLLWGGGASVGGNVTSFQQHLRRICERLGRLQASMRTSQSKK